MRRMRCLAFLCGVMLTMVFSGCEWSGSGSNDTWDNSVGWVNFSGVYTPASGNAYLVSTYGPAASTPESVVNGSDTLGTGNGIDSMFSGTLSNLPVSKGSASVTDGTETFVDPAGDGQLKGSAGGVGTISYATGAISVTFKLAPAIGHSVIVTYLYAKPGTTANQQPGSSSNIYSINVEQTGNQLVFTDNDGKQYTGTISSVTTPQGGATNILVSTTIIANFQVAGQDSAGQQVTIAGAFYGDYTMGGSLTAGTGTLQNRVMHGTWIEANGQTGQVSGSAGGTATITSTATNNVNVPWWWW